MNKKTIEEVLALLEAAYPKAQCELRFTTPFELLIATILSAQSTDERVNKVTQDLFKKHPTPHDFLTLSQEELEQLIKEIGLYHNKARHILAACRILVEDFGGEVPSDLDKLSSLPGVGRKTANVVAANAYGIPTIAVDTHVFRVANRIGLAHSENVVKVEKQLMDIIPKDQWIKTHHLLIWHGRRICKAKKPLCSECPLIHVCEYSLKPSP